MGTDGLPHAASSLMSKPMERQLLQQTVKKEGGFTFWQVQGEVTSAKLDGQAASSAGNVPGVSLHTGQVHPM